MQLLEVSSVVRPLWWSLGVIGLTEEEKIKEYSIAVARIEGPFSKTYYSYFKRRIFLHVGKYF